MNMNHTALTEQYLRLRSDLLAAHPELAEDVQALADTLEGETEITDTVARYIGDAIEDETLASAISERSKQLAERKARLTDRAEKRRAIALALMNAVGMRKLVRPEFTAGVRSTPARVEITDPELIPETLCRVVRSPDKTAIKEALQRGEAVPGAAIGNGGETLSIRTV